MRQRIFRLYLQGPNSYEFGYGLGSNSYEFGYGLGPNGYEFGYGLRPNCYEFGHGFCCPAGNAGNFPAC